MEMIGGEKWRFSRISSPITHTTVLYFPTYIESRRARFLLNRIKNATDAHSQ